MEPRRFTAELWRWDAQPSWTFVSLPADFSDDVAELAAAGPPRGFGAVRVSVRCGLTVWRTSVFPDRARGCYVLPFKKAVRTRYGLDAGDRVELEVEVLDT